MPPRFVIAIDHSGRAVSEFHRSSLFTRRAKMDHRVTVNRCSDYPPRHTDCQVESHGDHAKFNDRDDLSTNVSGCPLSGLRPCPRGTMRVPGAPGEPCIGRPWDHFDCDH